MMIFPRVNKAIDKWKAWPMEAIFFFFFLCFRSEFCNWFPLKAHPVLGNLKKVFFWRIKCCFLRRQSRRARFVYCSHSRRFCSEQFSIPRDNFLLSCRHKSRRETGKILGDNGKWSVLFSFFLSESRIEFSAVRRRCPIIEMAAAAGNGHTTARDSNNNNHQNARDKRTWLGLTCFNWNPC